MCNKFEYLLCNRTPHEQQLNHKKIELTSHVLFDNFQFISGYDHNLYVSPNGAAGIGAGQWHAMGEGPVQSGAMWDYCVPPKLQQYRSVDATNQTAYT